MPETTRHNDYLMWWQHISRVCV